MAYIQFKIDSLPENAADQLEGPRTKLVYFRKLNTIAQLLKDVQRRKLQCCGHVVRADRLSAFLLQRRIAGTRKQDRPRWWTDNVKDWIDSTVQ